MKKMIQSYAVFTTMGYRIFALIMIPLVFLAFSKIWMLGTEGESAEWLLMGYLVGFELLSDYWLFAGIGCKNRNGLEYIKTSRWGWNILRLGIVADLIRRFIYMMVFAAFCYMSSGELRDIAVVLIAYVFVVAALNLTRCLSTFQIYMAVSMMVIVVFELAAGIGVYFFFRGKPDSVVWLGIMLLTAAALMVSLVTVWHMGYRVKGSYYEGYN